MAEAIRLAPRAGFDPAAVAAGLPGARWRSEVPLASLCRWRIGGPADLFVEPADEAQLSQVLAHLARERVPAVVIGHGCNLLFDDAGLRGAVVRMGAGFRRVSHGPGGRVEAGAGCWVPAFVRGLIARGLAGAEHAIGIPGTLGGLVAMNGGSRRHSIGANVVAVDALTLEGRPVRLERGELEFAYRRSRLQRAPMLVATRIALAFAPGSASVLRREALGILADRCRKFPRNRANCGSVFVSDPALYHRCGPPGAAIEAAGLKGLRHGGAAISAEHANFIVNTGGARSAEVLHLIETARTAVARQFGVELDCEVRHVRPDGTVLPAHLAQPGCVR